MAWSLRPGHQPVLDHRLGPAVVCAECHPHEAGAGRKPAVQELLSEGCSHAIPPGSKMHRFPCPWWVLASRLSGWERENPSNSLKPWRGGALGAECLQWRGWAGGRVYVWEPSTQYCPRFLKDEDPWAPFYCCLFIRNCNLFRLKLTHGRGGIIYYCSCPGLVKRNSPINCVFNGD